MATEIILRQLLVFGILIAIGALAYWRGIITPEMKNSLARIVIDVTLPFLIFTTFTKMEANPSLLRNGLLVFGLAFLNLYIFYWIGKISSKILKLGNPQETVHTLHTMLGNIVFLGFPLLDALFPNGVGVFYGAVYQLASNAVTFTYGVFRLSKGTQKSGWRSLINSNTLALVLGAGVLMVGFSLPSAVEVSFESLGRSTSPLSMMYVGAMLASMNIRKTMFQKSIYILSFNKLLLVPSVLAFAYIFVLNFLGVEYSKDALFVVILQAAMPCQAIVVVLAHRFNGDHQLAGANLFVTTILCIATLPIVFIVLAWLWVIL